MDQPVFPDDIRSKPRLFLTPQPKRKQYNVSRNQSFNEFDEVHGSKSPVERLATMAKLRKGLSSSSSDSTPSPGNLSATSPQFSMSSSSSSPSPSPRSLTSSKSPSSSSQHSSISTTPSSISSPKFYPISPLASASLVTNTQKSPLSGSITWQTRPKSEEYGKCL